MTGMLVFVAVVLPLLMFGLIVNSCTADSNASKDVPKSTINRTKLTNTADGPVLRYENATKDDDWFGSGASDLTNRANEANKLTGVKFGIYVTEGYYSDDELDELANDVYDEWFGGSQGHLLIVLTDLRDDNFKDWYAIGNQALTVFDENEAMPIFNGYLSNYWSQVDGYGDYKYSGYQIFGMALEDTAKRIMGVTFWTTIAPYLSVEAVILVVVIGLIIFLKVKTKRDEAAADLARADAELLSTPPPGDGTAPQSGWESQQPPQPPQPPGPYGGSG
jgi:hypothetical protein